MMNKKYALFVTIIIILVIGCIVIYLPQNPPKKISPPVITCKKKSNLTNKLHLTPKQIIKFNQLKDQTKQKLKPQLIQLKKEKLEYKELKKNKAKKDILLKQKNKISSLIKKIKLIQKQYLLQFEKLLSKKQKLQFDNIKEKAQEKPGSF